jgi:hypothetical protein
VAKVLVFVVFKVQEKLWLEAGLLTRFWALILAVEKACIPLAAPALARGKVTVEVVYLEY